MGKKPSFTGSSSCSAKKKWRVTTPLGRMVIETCSNGLHSLGQAHDGDFQPEFGRRVILDLDPAHGDDEEVKTVVQPVVEWLTDFFRSEMKESHAIPLCFSGFTPFQVAVWTALRDKTTFGDRLTYKALAELVGRPGAYRAVGQAMAGNPFQLIVPCHRVLLCSGKAGHYARGKHDDVKKWLLGLESKNTWLDPEERPSDAGKHDDERCL